MQRKQPTSVAFDRDLTVRLDKEAARLRISRSELVRRIVARYFSGLDGDGFQVAVGGLAVGNQQAS